MADYTATIARANAAIQAKGMPMIFVSVTVGEEYDPEFDGHPTTEAEHPVYGVKTVPTVEEVQGGAFAVGGMVILLAGNAVPGVTTKDYLKFSGKKWTITAVKPVAPAASIILYKVQVADAGRIVESEHE